ncbi:MAG: hypothetical protein JSR18_00920 [Proteobacteria bacterium]|nr:hypothetical protein [Pseudomonadota bacterium]
MSLRLARRHRLAVDCVLGAVLITGVAWLLLDGGDALDSERRLWLRNAVRLHALAALATVYLIGTLWFMHIRRAWRTHRNRVAGVATFVVLALLVATGYALDYLTGEAEHATMARMHWIAGLMAVAFYVVHRVRGAATRPADARAIPAAAPADRP